MASSKANSKIKLVSGGFDPIHSGHIALLRAARRDFTDSIHTMVALNSDDWLVRKKGSYFMSWEERASILRNMEGVQEVFKFNDDDGSACDAIEILKKRWPDKIIQFHNGGDRTNANILEVLRYADDPQVEFHFASGGIEKQNSSSDILKDWLDRHTQLTEREWGAYNVLNELRQSKVKTLRVAPGKSLSMQKHEHRAEHWFVAWGTATVQLGKGNTKLNMSQEITQHRMITIPKGVWHQLSNYTDEDLFIVEIQYGEMCEESDIVRESR